MSTERSKDGIPEVTVTFPEHQSDIMLLNRFYLNEEDRIAGQNSHKTFFELTYCTRAIISLGLYIFYPIFKDHFFVFKEVFSENSVLIYGLYSRAAYDGMRTVCT